MADQVSDLLNSKQLTRGNVFAFLALFVCKLLKINKLLVEAAGVEPASEIAVSRESPCCVRFDWFRSRRLRTDKMRRKLVRLVSRQPPGPSRLRQPTE